MCINMSQKVDIMLIEVKVVSYFIEFIIISIGQDGIPYINTDLEHSFDLIMKFSKLIILAKKPATSHCKVAGS